MFRSSDTSPSGVHMSLQALEEYGRRSFKPLPKRRRVADPEDREGLGLFTLTPGAPGSITTTTTSGTTTTTTTTAQDRSWSITANFPNVDKTMNMNSPITREQFMAHAGELAKRLTHSLQGRLSAADRMEFIQSMLQQQQMLQAAQQALSQEAGAASQANGEGGDLPSLLPLPNGNGAMGPSATYSVSVPIPGLSPDAKFDLDAVFAAGFEAGLAGAVGGFDPFDESVDGLPESWEEVAEIYYSHRSPTLPAYLSGTANGQTSSDLGRRAARDLRDDDEEEGDADYDHLRQQGNTKKRKVPANVGASPGSRRGGGEGDDGHMGEGDLGNGYGGVSSRRGVGQRGGSEDDEGAGCGEQLDDKGSPYGSAARAGLARISGAGSSSPNGVVKPFGRLPLMALSNFASTAPPSARVGQLKAIVQARGKLAAAMVAGIQHKEMLKTRKRQLAAVMGVLSGTSNSSSADASAAASARASSLALDQALSMVGYLPSPSPASKNPESINPKASSSPVRGSGASTRDKRKAEGDGKENDVGLALPEQQGPPIRLSKRIGARLARTAAAMGKATPGKPTLPDCDFTFAVDSAAKDRLIATKEEVKTLRNRFEAELQRQAANTAKLAAASKALVGSKNSAKGVTGGTSAPPVKGSEAKKTKPKKTKTNASPTKPKKNAATPQTSRGVVTGGKTTVEQSQPTNQVHSGQPQRQTAANNAKVDAGTPLIIPGGKPKKKKRSAMANASNPHHLRNYVPSRLPHSAGEGGPHGGGGAQNGGLGLLSPLPLRFLAAELPPRRGSGKRADGKKNGANGTTGAAANGGPGSTLVIPASDEWICAFCEYDLFYGDDAAYKRAVNGRKKILKRRRRARERAAAAANGVKTFGKGQTHPAPAQQPGSATSDNAVMGQSEGEEEEDEEYDSEDYDGDPGYEEGGNGKDEFGNVPKYQTNGEYGGGTGTGQNRHTQGVPVADPAG